LEKKRHLGPRAKFIMQRFGLPRPPKLLGCPTPLDIGSVNVFTSLPQEPRNDLLKRYASSRVLTGISSKIIVKMEIVDGIALKSSTHPPQFSVDNTPAIGSMHCPWALAVAAATTDNSEIENSKMIDMWI
jgi:hypothetical protein